GRRRPCRGAPRGANGTEPATPAFERMTTPPQPRPPISGDAMNPTTICRAIGISVAATALITGGASAQSKPEYNRDIRPILADNCFASHRPDRAARKASLPLDP